jgi:polyisoprenoid-binding protein YceI
MKNMILKSAGPAFFILAGIIETEAQVVTWNVDHSHSSVKFNVSHLVISEVEGSFKTYDGTITSPNEDFTDAEINFTVDAASINTENERRDNHLKSDDFFNAEKYPQIKFISTSFRKISANKYELTGDLTIRDVTKRVKFDVEYGGTANDGYGNTKAGFKATTKINRFDYGLKWNAITEAGGMTVGSDVKLILNLQFAKKSA